MSKKVPPPKKNKQKICHRNLSQKFKNMIFRNLKKHDFRMSFIEIWKKKNKNLAKKSKHTRHRNQKNIKKVKKRNLWWKSEESNKEIRDRNLE